MSPADWFRDMFAPGVNHIDADAREASARAFLNSERKRPPRWNGMIPPSRDEFRAWRDDLTTQFVFAALSRNAEECREAWIKASWEKGECDEVLLIAMRERSDALLGFTADYEAFCETLGLEPEKEETDAER